jgi:hypothetical protein
MPSTLVRHCLGHNVQRAPLQCLWHPKRDLLKSLRLTMCASTSGTTVCLTSRDLPSAFPAASPLADPTLSTLHRSRTGLFINPLQSNGSVPNTTCPFSLIDLPYPAAPALISDPHNPTSDIAVIEHNSEIVVSYESMMGYSAV